MKGGRFILSHKEAVARLTARYAEQAEKFPRLRETVPLALYISRNVRAVRVFGSLGEYRLGEDYAKDKARP